MLNCKNLLLLLYPCLCVFALGQVDSNLGPIEHVDSVHSESVANKGIRGSHQIPSMARRRGERKLQIGGDTVVTFYLYDAIKDIQVATLANGTVINLKAFGILNATALNIEAVVLGSTLPGSVKLSLDVSVHNRLENSAPFTLCGDSGQPVNFSLCPKLIPGLHTVQAIPYSGKSATGIMLGSHAVSFSIVDVPVPVPIPVPVSVPVLDPAPVPLPVPLPVPVSAPVPVSVPVLDPAPVTLPVPVPVPIATSCGIPKLNATWERWTPYPLTILEGMGAMVGDHFFVVSGFQSNFKKVTQKIYGYNTTNRTATWRAFDDVPVPGFSHSSLAVDGLLMYVCGAYVGISPGPDSDICLKFSPTSPSGSQWTLLPNMPIGRGGGGLVHSRATNSLLFATGATRRNGTTTDFHDAYEFDLTTQVWTKRPDVPYKANHVSHVTATYQGEQRHYILGGQLQQNEAKGNQKLNFEWDAINKRWIRRADLVPARGHATSSTVAYGCGFLIMGGSVNNSTLTSDVSYYSIETDTWTKIGDLPRALNTPICDIVRLGEGGDWLYCIMWSNSWRTRISQN